MSRVRGRPKGGYIPDSERKPALQRIKERHRLLAKFVAAGLTRNEVAARLDMTPERVGQLMLDPAMQNLVAQFRDHPDVTYMTGMDEIALIRSITAQNTLRAALAMQDTLNYYEDADEKVPVRESAKIFELGSDRIGFGKHVTNTNINVDFAAQLDRAIDASRRVRTINASPSLTLVPPSPVKPNARDEEGQESRGEVPAPASVRARSVQGNDPTPSSEPLRRRF